MYLKSNIETLSSCSALTKSALVSQEKYLVGRREHSELSFDILMKSLLHFVFQQACHCDLFIFLMQCHFICIKTSDEINIWYIKAL